MALFWDLPVLPCTCEKVSTTHEMLTKKQSLQLSPKKPFSSHISHDSHVSFADIFHYWWWESPSAKVFCSASHRLSLGLRSGICGGQKWWKWCLMPREPHFHSLSQKNPGTGILEHASAIREQKIHWWKNQVVPHIQVVSWSHFFRYITLLSVHLQFSVRFSSILTSQKSPPNEFIWTSSVFFHVHVHGR